MHQTKQSQSGKIYLHENRNNSKTDECTENQSDKLIEGITSIIHKTKNSDDLFCTKQGSSTLKVVLFGQLLSIVDACTGAASTTLANSCGINSPTAQTFFMYILLSSFIFQLPRHDSDSQIYEKIENKEETIEEGRLKKESEPDCHPPYNLPGTKYRLQAPWYRYAILALLDLEANYFTYYAYRFTSFTSITLLASLAIPSSMLFSRVFIQRQYHIWHYCGVLLCFVGFIMTLGSDLNDNDRTSIEAIDTDVVNFPHAYHGDLLAIIGAIIYGLNDTLTELSVHKASNTELLGAVGIFGMIFSIFQIIFLEPQAFSELFDPDSSSCSTTTSTLLLTWNAVSLALFYIGLSYFLVNFDAALLNISLLTTNLYAISFVIWSEHFFPPHPLRYILSVSIVVFGIYVYDKGSSFPLLNRGNVDEGENDCSKENFCEEIEIDTNGYGALDFGS